ncbi:hypothetical protein HYT26_04250 [Candidatus Pacearchaeota archaeon]|nr:hypothetical protein [Candidatus Pacearchaeota archaeon]
MVVKTSPREEIEVRCKYLDKCPDTIKLEESINRGVVNENLADQSHELCLTASQESCSIYQGFEAQYKKQYKDIDIGF